MPAMLAMTRRGARSILAFATVSSLGLAPHAAQAQLVGTSGTSGSTTSTKAENVSAAGTAIPVRLVNGAAVAPRPQNLNPTGINYSDCISDMELQFSIALSGFAATDLARMQIWATKSGDCQALTERGGGGNAVPVCWPLGQGTPADFVAVSAVTETFTLRVQDIVGQQNGPTVNYVRQGPEACATQATYAAIPMNLWFLALDSGGNPIGTSYNYPITVDMVGPPAPVGVTESVGDTLFNVTWTPNIDADTAGYDIYIDPTPGSTTLGSADGAVSQLICPDAGAVATGPGADEASVEAGALDDAGNDAASVDDASSTVDASSIDATVSTPPPSTGSGCYNAPILPPSATGQTSCTSTILSNGIVTGAGGSVTTTQVDEAGNAVSTVVSGNGGISTIPPANLVAINSGFTIASEGSGAFTLTGLTNDIFYNVVVASVDGSGNIGPPSAQVCDYPAPVNDFWKTYRNAGGLAGGGFCALEAVGLPVGPTVAFAGVGAAVLALARRRRRRRR